MARSACWLVAALLLAACGNADAGEPSPDLAEHAAPLVAAHERLEEHAALVEDDPAAAARAWPDVEQYVAAALDVVHEPEGLDLEPRERSTVVGYVRGLEVALGAWRDVHDALDAGEHARAERAAQEARERMRHLERLRAGVTP